MDTTQKIDFADVNFEYYKCINPFSGSLPSVLTNPTLTCQLSPTISCNFNVNTNLFDSDAVDCSKDEWIYSPDRNQKITNQVTADFYLKPDLSNSNCVKISSIQDPTLGNGFKKMNKNK